MNTMLSPIKLLLAATITASMLSACGGISNMRSSSLTSTALTSEPDASTRIAVMLPTSGKYAKVSAAIRSGMELVNNRRPLSQRPQLAFYDSGSGISDALLASTSDSDILVGPLSRENVDFLMRTNSRLPASVITLNQISNNSPSGIYQFGLSPDEDGRQVASKAFADGHRTASILYPQSAWGQRYLDGFNQHWQALGGVTATIASYPIAGQEPDTGSDRKTAREELNTAVKSVLENSGDFVYVVGKPAKARELRTFLLYYGNFNLPVYISSRAFDRRLFSHNTADLRNAWMPAMPIVIPEERQETSVKVPQTSEIQETVDGASEGESPAEAETSTAAIESLALAPQDNEPNWDELTGAGSQPEATSYISSLSGNGNVPGWNDISALPGFNSNYASYYAMGIDAMLLALNTWQLTPNSYISGSSGLLYSDEAGIIRRHPAWIYYDKNAIRVLPPTVR